VDNIVWLLGCGQKKSRIRDSIRETNKTFYSTPFRLVTVLTQPLIQWLWKALSLEVRFCLKVTSRPYFVLRLKMRGFIPQLHTLILCFIYIYIYFSIFTITSTTDIFFILSRFRCRDPFNQVLVAVPFLHPNKNVIP
jgi:hypothetical protein